MDVTPQTLNALRWGELGVLLVVLVGLGVFARQYLIRMQAFFEQLVTDILKARNESIAAMQNMLDRFVETQTANVVAQERTVACLQQITLDVKSGRQQTRDEHKAIDGKLDRALNDKRKAAEERAEQLERTQGKEGGK